MFEYYKNAFLNSDTTIFWGGESITRNWDDGTMYLYFGVILLVMFIGRSMNNKAYSVSQTWNEQVILNANIYKGIRKQWFFLFGLFLIFLGTRHYTVGIDTLQYINNIENVEYLGGDFKKLEFEPLFRVILYILHYTLPSAKWGILVISALSLFFIFGGLRRYVQSIDIYTCFLVFTCLYIFPSMNLARITLAASIVFYNARFLLEEKYKYFALTIFVAFLIHFSSIVVFLPLLIYILSKKSRTIAFTAVIGFIILVVSSTYIFGDFLSVINRYSDYLSNDSSAGKIGIMAFVDYLPCLYICYIILRERNTSNWAELTLSFTASAFAVRIIAYYIPAAGRLHVHFMILTMLLLPYWIRHFRELNRSLYTQMKLFVTMWALFRLHIYFTGYLASDGIMPYHFFWWG